MVESIYNLIEKPKQDVPKQPMYRSKYDPKAPLTGSTFGLHGTTVTVGKGINDLKRVRENDEIAYQLQCISFLRPFISINHLKYIRKTCVIASTFGPTPEKPDPSKFLRKGSRLASQPAPSNKRFKKEVSNEKPPVPSRDDKPVMGLHTCKNFVVANATEAICMEPKKIDLKKTSFLEKEDYGQVPKYLFRVKDEIEKEKRIIKQFVKENAMKEGELTDEPIFEVLDENERQGLINALKTKWDQVNSKYQKVCHRVMIDSIGELRRKESQEAELQQLEDDIERLSRPGPIYIKKE
jgi:hypothetical protein